MKISIEKYRGYEIEFDTDAELFLSDVGNEGKESKTLSGAKKQVDDYIKQNATFVPFEMVNARWGSCKMLTLTGIRKDKRFIDSEGNQFSEGDERDSFVIDHALLKEFNEDVALLEKAEKEARENTAAATKKRENFITTKGIPLRQYKTKLLERLGL